MRELDWLSKNLKEIRGQYKGNWIAIKDDKVVAFAPELKILLNEIPEEVDRPFVTFIPEEEPVWKGIYAYSGIRNLCGRKFELVGSTVEELDTFTDMMEQ